MAEDSLKQLPKGYRSGRKIVIRTDSAAGIRGFLDWLVAKHRKYSYSVGFPIHGPVGAMPPLIPKEGWAKAYDSDGFERDGAWVTDITGMLDLSYWPTGIRVIIRTGSGAQKDGLRPVEWCSSRRLCIGFPT